MVKNLMRYLEKLKKMSIFKWSEWRDLNLMPHSFPLFLNVIESP